MRELVARGRTADVPIQRTPRSEKRTIPRVPIFVGVVLVAIVVCAVMFKPDSEPPATTGTIPTDTTDAIVRIDGGNFTRWYFPDIALEDNCSFCFEVHTCSGENGSIEVWNHRWIETFNFYGQTDVYLGYMHYTYYLDWVYVWDWWGWFGNVTADYRAGLWTPSDGIEFRHSENQTFGNAVLVVLYVPSAIPDPIPEFSSVLIPVAAIGVVVMILIRRRG